MTAKRNSERNTFTAMVTHSHLLLTVKVSNRLYIPIQILLGPLALVSDLLAELSESDHSETDNQEDHTVDNMSDSSTVSGSSRIQTGCDTEKAIMKSTKVSGQARVRVSNMVGMKPVFVCPADVIRTLRKVIRGEARRREPGPVDLSRQRQCSAIVLYRPRIPHLSNYAHSSGRYSTLGFSIMLRRFARIVGHAIRGEARCREKGPMRLPQFTRCINFFTDPL